jgi:hypothetical protein
LAGAARPTGLRVDSRERLHHPTSTAAIVVISSCVLFQFSFQFFTRLAAVFAEEVDHFGSCELDGPI